MRKISRSSVALSTIQCEVRNRSETDEKTSLEWKYEFLSSNLHLQLEQEDGGNWLFWLIPFSKGLKSYISNRLSAIRRAAARGWVMAMLPILYF